MAETLTLTSERVDDIPLLIAQQERMGVAVLLDEHFPTHGNWQGLSLGRVTVGWLAHILSQADHRMNHVQSWAEQRQETLSQCLGQAVCSLDWSDDRLEAVVRALSDDERWEAFEGDLNRHLLRVYDLKPERVRHDGTTASGYWSVTPEGLFQLGHSKAHRPDLPQVKIMLSALDPLGLPAVTLVVSGEQADDPLYVPAIQRVQQSLGRQGLLHVGDCKMAALATRAFVQASEDYYLCPLSEVQLPQAHLTVYLAPVWTGEQTLTPIEREPAEGQLERVAEGFERLEVITAVMEGQTITWTERRLVIRSLRHAQAAERALRARLTKAQTDLAALNERGRGKKRFTEVAALQPVAEAIIERYRVPGLLHLTFIETTQEHPVRRYRDRPATVHIEREVQVMATVDETAWQEAVRALGWRVYVTNQPAEQLPLTQAVWAYRSEYLVEHDFGRLKGHPLSLSPMYVQRDDHATGLIRLLSVGLRVLTLLEFEVRRHLETDKAQLTGLYAGNPKRATARPTAERLLEAFQGITLTRIEEPDRIRYHLTPLSQLQQRILGLLNFSVGIYAQLSLNSRQLGLKTSEP
jgi:transposase